MLILVQLKNDNITAYYFNDIVVDRYQDEDSLPVFKLYQNGYLSVDKLNSLTHYVAEPETYVYGFTKDEIYEWKSLGPGIRFTQVATYKYLMVCDPTKPKDIIKIEPFMIMYCYNSATESNDDMILLFNTQLNKKDNAFYPIQQLNIPDSEYPKNLLLAGYASPSGAKLLISNSRNFITQYHLNKFSSVEWSHGNMARGVRSKLGIYTENIIATEMAVIDFKAVFSDLVTSYIGTIEHSVYIMTICLLYLLVLGCLIRLRDTKETSKRNLSHEGFVQEYKDVMYEVTRNKYARQQIALDLRPQIGTSPCKYSDTLYPY